MTTICLFALCVIISSGTQAVKLYLSVELGYELAFDSARARHTTYVEGTEGQLCTRLTDRLCGNDTNGITTLRHVAGSKVLAIALRAHATLAFAGKH